MSETLFKDIIDRKIPADIVVETDELIGFKDVNPQAPHHVLFVPKKHLRTVNDLGEEDAPLIGKLFLAAKAYAASVGVDDEGYRLVMNCQAGAGQSVWHIHLHFLAGRPMKWPPG